MRRRVAAAAAALVIVAAAAVALATRGPSPPPDRAAQLVPAGALAYVHVATDRDRALVAALERLPTFRTLRARLEAGVAQRAGAFDVRRDVESWLGDEAAAALLDTGTATANVLLLFRVAKEATAQGVLARVAGAQRAVAYRGIVVRRFGSVAAAFVGGFLVVGEEAAVRQAIDLHAGRGRALASAPAYVRARRPADRSADAWMSPDGVRRVLRPQAGLAGAVGAALDTPGLQGVALSAAARGHDLTLHVTQLRTGPPPPTFGAQLLDGVDAGAAAYLGLASPQPLRALVLARLQALMPARQAQALLAPLREVAASVSPGAGVPTITVAARTVDPAGTRQAMAELQEGIAQATLGSENQTGQVPTFEERDLPGGIQAFALRLAAGAEVLYTVAGDRLIVSTDQTALEHAAAGAPRKLRDEERFRAAVPATRSDLEALAFLDLRQLLALGDAAGLSAGRSLGSVRADLQAVEALGVAATRQGTDTTVELHLRI